MTYVPFAMIGLLFAAMIGLTLYWARQPLGQPTDGDGGAGATVLPLQQWRSDALFVFALLQVLLATPAVVGDIVLAVQQGSYVRVVGNIVLYAILTFFGVRRDLPLRLRALVIVGAGYLFAVYLLWAYGLIGAGRILFISNIVCAALFIGWRGALASWLGALGALLSFYWAISTGVYVQPPMLAERVFLPASVLNNGVVTLQNAAFLAVLVVWLGRRLVQSLQATEAARAALASANDSLEQRVAERTAALQRALDTNRAREHFIERVTQTTPDVIYVYDLDAQRNIYSNQASLDMLGYAPKALQGLGDALGRTVIAPEAYNQLAAHHARVARAADREVIALEYPVVRKDGARSWLLSRDVVFARDEAGRATQILGIAQDITQRKQVELALQHVNATLERRIEELVVLNHIAQALTRWTDLHDALGTVQTNLARLFAAAEVSVWRLDGGAALTRLNGSKTQAMPAVPVDTPLMRRVIGERETILLRPEEGLPTELAFNGATGGALLVPLQIRNAATGLLCLRAAQRERVYTPDEVALAQTVAGVLAGAIENAQLFAQAQRLAAQEERQRLSRDLHDSVSQALFAASVSADVAPQLWELDPDEGREMLQEVRRLTRGALAEMRMLLVELRPAQLLHTPLQELLNHLVTAANTRLRGTATVQIAPLPMLPLELRVALYRIAQEALGNIVKHAQATRIMLSLHTSPPVASEGATDWTGSLELCIADDGRGFTATDAATRRGIGLYSMEERAHGVRATLQIDSTPGNGTRISVCWQGAACYIGD